MYSSFYTTVYQYYLPGLYCIAIEKEMHQTTSENEKKKEENRHGNNRKHKLITTIICSLCLLILHSSFILIDLLQYVTSLNRTVVLGFVFDRKETG